MAFFINLHAWSDLALLALRVGVAAIFWHHGSKKWVMWKQQSTPGSMVGTMKFLSVVEPLGAIAMLVGFLTQLAAVGLGIIMIGAITKKIRAWNVPFFATDKTGWELDFILLTVCVALFFLGPGAWALDRVWLGL